MKKYNHAYTIAFQLETTREDPYKDVLAHEIIGALLDRVGSFIKDLNSPAISELFEAIDCFDTIEIRDEALVKEG